MKNNKKNIIIIGVLIIFTLISGYYSFWLREKYLNTLTNNYNKAFSEAVNCINKVENFLAKAQISKTIECSAENLAEIWNDSNLAMTYLSEIPFDSEGSGKTIKFLNQVSDYSYMLAKKNLRSAELSEKDFENLKNLYEYSKELENVLNDLSEDLYSGKISWKQLQNKGSMKFAQEVSNIEAFSSIDSTFNEYEGLIYDGAYSEHLNRNEKRGLVGNEISEEEAKEKITSYIQNKEIEEIKSYGLAPNSDIEVYSFWVNTKDKKEFYIDITKNGGLLLQMNCNEDINDEKITQEEANEIGKKYLENIGFSNMKETYFTKRENIVTINYAYVDENVIFYPDLIKVKISLENGDIIGVETKGYINCHYKRNIEKAKVDIKEAKKNLNPNLKILYEGMAVIPTDEGKEIQCYEFKGLVEDKNFIVYTNIENGKEENILVILETEGGTLTI